MVDIEVMGIPCAFDDECMDDIELLEVVAEIDGGDMLKLPLFFKAVYGEEQYENIKRSIKREDPDGRVRITTMWDFYKQSMDAAAEAKKADAKN